MNNRDAGSLWDMVQAIEEIQEHVKGLTYDDFQDSRLVRRAVERCFEILGEAARRISPEFQSQHPDIRWREVIGLRNVLAHQYESVRYEVLWDVIMEDLPALKPKLNRLLPSIEEP
jgi:uncharacterized protein with HEPN domain